MKPKTLRLIGILIAILGFGVATVSIATLFPQANEGISFVSWLPVAIGFAVMIGGGTIVFYWRFRARLRFQGDH
jgi:hypothetical protein